MIAHFITTQNYAEYARLACRTFQAYTPEDVELHLVDDHSTDVDAIALCDELEASGRWRVWRHRDEARGLTHGWNEALQYCLDADLDFVGIHNNDIAIGPNFHEALMRTFKIDPDLGITGPLTNNPGHQPQQGILREEGPSPMFGRLSIDEVSDYMVVNGLCYWLRNWCQVKQNWLHYLPYTNGFCYMLRGQVVKDIGLFDARNRNVGNEDEYQARMVEAGWKSGCSLETFTWHAKRVTLGGVKTHPGCIMPRLDGKDIVT